MARKTKFEISTCRCKQTDETLSTFIRQMRKQKEQQIYRLIHNLFSKQRERQNGKKHEIIDRNIDRQEKANESIERHIDRQKQEKTNESIGRRIDTHKQEKTNESADR